MSFLGPMPILILRSLMSHYDTRYISQFSIYYVLNVVTKDLCQRFVMKAGYLTKFIPNISALTSKHFIIIYFLLNNGPPSARQTT